MTCRTYVCADCGDEYTSLWAASLCCDVASNDLDDPWIDRARE